MICHYETRIRNPATDTVLRLTKALDVSVDQLMGYKNYKEKKEDIFSRKTFRRAKLLDKLPEKDKKTVYSLIDALASKGNHPKKD
jgi:hypothetical protein